MAGRGSVVAKALQNYNIICGSMWRFFYYFNKVLQFNYLPVECSVFTYTVFQVR